MYIHELVKEACGNEVQSDSQNNYYSHAVVSSSSSSFFFMGARKISQCQNDRHDLFPTSW